MSKVNKFFQSYFYNYVYTNLHDKILQGHSHNNAEVFPNFLKGADMNALFE